MKTCPKCSLVYNDNVAKCSYCGYDFPASEFSETPTENPIEVNAEQPVQNPEMAQQPVNQSQPNYNYYQQPNYAPPFKYCPYCGNQCDINAVVCVKCGRSFQPMGNAVSPNDTPSTGLKVLSFLIPLAGLILYLVKHDKEPVSAKAYGKMALIGFVVRIALSIIIKILSSVIFSGIFGFNNGYNDYYYDGDWDYYYSMIKSFIMSI